MGVVPVVCSGVDMCRSSDYAEVSSRVVPEKTYESSSSYGFENIRAPPHGSGFLRGDDGFDEELFDKRLTCEGIGSRVVDTSSRVKMEYFGPNGLLCSVEIPEFERVFVPVGEVK